MMISYPLTVGLDRGLSISTDEIGEQILALIDTSYFERSLFPDFGCPLIPFEATTPESLGLSILQTSLEVQSWVTDKATVEDITTDIEEGTIAVKISHAT